MPARPAASRRFIITLIVVGALAALGATTVVFGPSVGIYLGPTPTPRRPPDLSWEGSIGYMLNDECASCHGGVAGVYYHTYEAAMRGGQHGPVIIPFDALESRIVKKQSRGNHPGQLNDEQLQRLIAWINWGAPER